MYQPKHHFFLSVKKEKQIDIHLTLFYSYVFSSYVYSQLTQNKYKYMTIWDKWIIYIKKIHNTQSKKISCRVLFIMNNLQIPLTVFIQLKQKFEMYIYISLSRLKSITNLQASDSPGVFSSSKMGTIRLSFDMRLYFVTNCVKRLHK